MEEAKDLAAIHDDEAVPILRTPDGYTTLTKEIPKDWDMETVKLLGEIEPPWCAVELPELPSPQRIAPFYDERFF